MPETVLALDPGERVGWARAVLYEDGSWKELRHGITPLKDMALAVASSAGQYDTIVMESYRIQASKAKQHIGSEVLSLQFIGMVRLSAWMAASPRLVMQPPFPAKKTGFKVAPPEVQEILARMPKTHDDSHDADALAHLAYYWFNKYVPEDTEVRKENGKVPN